MALTPKWKTRLNAYRAENNQFFARARGGDPNAVVTPEEELVRGGYFANQDGRGRIKGVNAAQMYASRRAMSENDPEAVYSQINDKMTREEDARFNNRRSELEDEAFRREVIRRKRIRDLYRELLNQG